MSNPLDTMFQRAAEAHQNHPGKKIAIQFALTANSNSLPPQYPSVVNCFFGILTYSPNKSIAPVKGNTASFDGPVHRYPSNPDLYANGSWNPPGVPPFSVSPTDSPNVSIGLTFPSPGHPAKYLITLKAATFGTASIENPSFDDQTQILYGQISPWGFCTINLLGLIIFP